MDKEIEKLKVVYIHTDYKFIQDENRFIGDYFDNTLIIIENDEPYNGPCKRSAKCYKKDELNEVIDLCSDANLVVLYGLDLLKCQIALALPEHVKIAWRFFGYELYKRMKHIILSKRSFSFVSKERKSFKAFIKAILRPLYHRIKYGSSIDSLFHKAIKRIDYMFVISREEYHYLLQYWKDLPECLNLSIMTGNFMEEISDFDLSKKTNKVVLGNSRNITNNHFDVIELIEGVKKKHKFLFLMLFNYGVESDYTNKLRAMVNDKSYYQLIGEFIPKNEFNLFYDDVSALVINSYRQMAMGSIFLGIKSGVKIYLNKKNIMMDWLLNEGIQVFSIEDLSIDLQNENIKLDENTANNNIIHLSKLYKNYTKEEFQQKIYWKVVNEMKYY